MNEERKKLFLDAIKEAKEKTDELYNISDETTDEEAAIDELEEEANSLFHKLLKGLTISPLKLGEIESKYEIYLYKEGLGNRDKYDSKTRGITSLFSGTNTSLKTDLLQFKEEALKCFSKKDCRNIPKKERIKLAFKLLKEWKYPEKLEVSYDCPSRDIIIIKDDELREKTIDNIGVEGIYGYITLNKKEIDKKNSSLSQVKQIDIRRGFSEFDWEELLIIMQSFEDIKEALLKHKEIADKNYKQTKEILSKFKEEAGVYLGADLL